MVKYLSSHNSFFCLVILLNVKWQGHSVTHPLFVRYFPACLMEVPSNTKKNNNNNLMFYVCIFFGCLCFYQFPHPLFSMCLFTSNFQCVISPQHVFSQVPNVFPRDVPNSTTLYHITLLPFAQKLNSHNLY